MDIPPGKYVNNMNFIAYKQISCIFEDTETRELHSTRCVATLLIPENNQLEVKQYKTKTRTAITTKIKPLIYSIYRDKKYKLERAYEVDTLNDYKVGELQFADGNGINFNIDKGKVSIPPIQHIPAKPEVADFF